MKNYKIGVIGGSGIYTLKNYKLFADNFDHEFHHKNTDIEKYGFENIEIFFLPRHGENHTILPHEIDYLANMQTLSELDVNGIISFCTVGSMDSRFKAGTYVVPIDIIDFTQNRKGSNFVKNNKHVNIQPVFDAGLVSFFKQIFIEKDIPLVNDGVLVVIEGPRFATHAEQIMYKTFGGTFVNMTQAQEIYLSHVFEIPFISLCHITDMTSIVEKEYDIYSNEAVSTFRSNNDKVENILTAFLSFVDKNNPEIKYNNPHQTFV